jgi:hypothetical protein
MKDAPKPIWGVPVLPLSALGLELRSGPFVFSRGFSPNSTFLILFCPSPCRHRPFDLFLLITLEIEPCFVEILCEL